MLSQYESRISAVRLMRATQCDHVENCNSIHCDIIAGIISKCDQLEEDGSGKKAIFVESIRSFIAERPSRRLALVECLSSTKVQQILTERNNERCSSASLLKGLSSSHPIKTSSSLLSALYDADESSYLLSAEVLTANCARQKTEERRRLSKEYTIEYSALLHSVIEMSDKYQQMFPTRQLGSAKHQQRLVEGAYFVRILNKLIAEIESFLSDCGALGFK